ncbi:MAG: hypothetical protein HOJ64_01925 [Euryarchaeota archaeon]|nr:hypothetical protein [Euryarchaeota archaeon]
MASESKQRIIKQKKLECPICKNDSFSSQTANLNSTIANFLGISKNNQSFIGYICDDCGHILPFIKK